MDTLCGDFKDIRTTFEEIAEILGLSRDQDKLISIGFVKNEEVGV